MIKLTRRLVVLLVLIAPLLPLWSSSATPTSSGLYCRREIGPFGECNVVCCDAQGNCTSNPCWTRK